MLINQSGFFESLHSETLFSIATCTIIQDKDALRWPLAVL